jgi:hypothetical protein
LSIINYPLSIAKLSRQFTMIRGTAHVTRHPAHAGIHHNSPFPRAEIQSHHAGSIVHDTASAIVGPAFTPVNESTRGKNLGPLPIAV